MRVIYTVWRFLIPLVLLAGIVQIFLAGAIAFREEDARDVHATIGHLTTYFTVLLLVLALIARPARWVWLGNLILAAALVIQIVLGAAGEDEPWLGALHALNALVILAIAGTLVQRAWRPRPELPRGTTPPT